MSLATVAKVIDSWAICHSYRRKRTWNQPNISTQDLYTPPSQWNQNDYNKYCFLHRNTSEESSLFASSAPGTSLFQHWLSDFKDINNDFNETSWNPFTDFPTWNIMKRYPDISDDEHEIFVNEQMNISARDYYTLWYATNVTAPEITFLGDDSIYVPINLSGKTHHETDHKNVYDKQTRWRRGHLTIHGVNYQPVVYYNGNILSSYSIFGDGSSPKVDLGGMFLRRHYTLGVWNFNTNVKLPLEILVLPPPVVGKPTVSHEHTSADSALSSFASKNAEREPNNMRYSQEQPQGQGGDHNIAQSGAIMQCTAGWDWIQSTPDRNTGIWDKVEIEWIWGDVKLHDVFVKVVRISFINEGKQYTFNEKTDELSATTLPLGDNVTVSALLELSVTATRHDHWQTVPIEGKFDYSIWSHDAQNSKPKKSLENDELSILASGTLHNVKIGGSVSDYHIGQVFLPNAKLWWPHTHGSQPLYTAKIIFQSYSTNIQESNNTNASTTHLPTHEAHAKSTFGIRKIASYTHPKTKSFTLKVNGHSIFLTGGNWITSDQFLRYSTSTVRYLHELKLLKNVGFNSIRVWGGGITESSHFYDAADVLGLLIYQEFWMTGDNNGKFAGNYDWPLNHEAYLINARDVVIKLRNHPSLAWYGGGNELFPIPPVSSSRIESFDKKTSPPRDIEEGLMTIISKSDGSRPYVSSSVTTVGQGFDPVRSLGPKDGPYGILDEGSFFDRNPGLSTPLLTDQEIYNNVTHINTGDLHSPGRNIGFQTEVGSVSHPELKSLLKFLSQEAANSFPNCAVNSKVGMYIHHEWRYFKYLPFTETGNGGVDHICQFQYPPSENDTFSHRMDSIEDYTWAAQLAQYFQYKSLFEGYSHGMFEDFSAVYLWKSSSPAPTFRGALYDWYLATNGGYWGARMGLNGGNPLRILLNTRNWSIHLVNSHPLAVGEVLVQWEAYSMEGTLVKSGELATSDSHIEGNSVRHLGLLPWVEEYRSSIAHALKVQDVFYYRLKAYYKQASYGSTTLCNITLEAKNSYFMTDPSKTDHYYRRTRYSMLGALRKVLPRNSLILDCRLLAPTNDKIECKLQNPSVDRISIMTKLELICTHSPHDKKESHTLLSHFSDNYLTLLPEESLYVIASTNGIKLSCSHGYVKEQKDVDSYVMVSVDGWNIQQSFVSVSCVSFNETNTSNYFLLYQ